MTDVCPHCCADLRGEPIPDKYFVHDRETDDHKRSVEAHQRYKLTGECSCLPYGDRAPEDRFYKRTLGIEVNGVYDGVLFWRCPDCGDAWNRWPADHPLYERAERYVLRINADAA